MLNKTIQSTLYFRKQVEKELGNLLNLLNKGIYISVIFGIVEILRKSYFPNYEFYLSFMFWAVCILLILYWMPNKKEYERWKKTHLTF